MTDTIYPAVIEKGKAVFTLDVESIHNPLGMLLACPLSEGYRVWIEYEFEDDKSYVLNFDGSKKFPTFRTVQATVRSISIDPDKMEYVVECEI